MTVKKIIHIDMDCFYAAIEIRDNPSLRLRPIAVGGSSDRRGVLCTCNYIARKFGVKAAMPTAKALQLCPNLVVIPPRMETYKAISQEIREIFALHTDKIEPLSLDEAYLDVTGTEECFGSATLLAEKLRQEIFAKTKLTASAGISSTKFLAKIASDWHKPNGQFTISPNAIEKFMPPLPVGKIYGVGKVMLAKLHSIGIVTCADLQKLDLTYLTNQFGTMGKRLFEFCRGIDYRDVETNRERKSISVEYTYPHDLLTLTECLAKLPILMQELQRRCVNAGINEKQNQHFSPHIKTIFVKIKFNDFTQTTVDCSFEKIQLDHYQTLLKQAFLRKEKPVRLLGIGLRLNHQPQRQLALDFT